MADERTKLAGYLDRDLGDHLLTDLWDCYIFNERDMQACAYQYLRRFVDKHRNEHWFVRCEPPLKGLRPDLCLFFRYDPIYVIELKLFEGDYDERLLTADIEKLKEIKKDFHTVRGCFVVFIYDSNEMYPELTSYWRRKLGLDGFHAVPINARRRRATERRRKGYDDWKNQWDRYIEWHKTPAERPSEHGPVLTRSLAAIRRFFSS